MPGRAQASLGSSCSADAKKDIKINSIEFEIATQKVAVCDWWGEPRLLLSPFSGPHLLQR